jgi:hypothetical protein
LKPNDFLDMAQEIYESRVALFPKKGADYAKDFKQNQLQSFVDIASIMNTLQVDGHSDYTPAGIARFFIVTKIVRDSVLRNSKVDPCNESRLDTVMDLMNYIDLMVACERDEKVEPNIYDKVKAPKWKGPNERVDSKEDDYPGIPVFDSCLTCPLGGDPIIPDTILS